METVNQTITIGQIASSILHHENLTTRALVQTFLRSRPVLAEIAEPQTDDPVLLSVAAALLELFALRTRQPAPDWTRRVGPVQPPLYLLSSAATMRRLRELCREGAPEPLRRRHLYAPPDYLVFA